MLKLGGGKSVPRNGRRKLRAKGGDISNGLKIETYFSLSFGRPK
jgi:hypothetical protein